MSRGGIRYGAGRPAWRLKLERCKRIGVTAFQRAGMLAPGHWGWQWTDRETGDVLASIGVAGAAGCVTLNYSVDGAHVSERIAIVRSACALGGSRPWFRCPRCAGRVGFLYLRGSRFACRHCQRLAYASQSEDLCGRTWRRQQRLEDRLGDHLSRPKGMHRRTHERILDAIWACESARDDALVAYCQRIGFKL